jgi:hypothetical protein
MNKEEIIKTIRSWIVLSITTVLSIISIIVAFACVEIINHAADYPVNIRIGAFTLLILIFMGVKVLFYVADKYI